jgi:hypothetical protein
MELSVIAMRCFFTLAKPRLYLPISVTFLRCGEQWLHVHQLTDGLEIRSAIGDVGVDCAKHVQSCLVEAQKHAVVDLAQAQQLQDLARLGIDTVNAARNA